MNASQRSRWYLFFESVPKAVSFIAIAVGTIVLIGWVFNLDVLKSVLPGLTFMKANTAAGFILAGLALLGIQKSSQNRRLQIGTQICASILLLLALFTLLEYLTGTDFGIDQLLIREVTRLKGDMPGRMAMNTAVSFSALSVALLLLSLRKSRLVVVIHVLAIVPLILGGSALIGYSYDIDEFLREKLNYTPMALTTAAVFVLLTLGVLNARADFPFRRFASSSNPAGVMVRRLLPAAIVFTLTTGWMIHLAYHAGYFGEIFVQALFSTVIIAGLGAMILAIARTLYSTAIKQERLEESSRSAALYARSLIEASLDPLVTISADGKITDVNEATIKATGVTRESLIGSEFSSYFTDPDKARAGYREVFLKGFVTDYPLTLRHVSGRVMEVIYNANVYRDARGEVAGVFASARDITERKRTEEALRRSAEEIEDLYNRAPIGYHSVNKDGTIVRINDTELAWLGYSRDEVVGKKNFADLLTPESLKTFRATFAGSKARGWVRDLEYDMVRGDGTVLPVLLNATAVKDAQGNFVMSRSTIYDITERRKLEARILEAASYARSLIEASPDPLVTVSAEGMITDVNEATIRATGVSREELLGSDFSNYFTEPDKARAGYKEVFEKGFVTDYPLALRHASGSLMEVLYNASIYRNEKGEVAGVFAAARDVTKVRRAEKLMRERVKELQAFFHLSELAARKDFPLESLCRELAFVLPDSWQYPEIACARIVIREDEFRTANFGLSEWMQMAPVKSFGVIIGKIEVGYLEQKPDQDEGPFLKEERQLIDSIAERVGQILELKHAESELKTSEELFRALANATSEGMIIHEQGQIVEANRQMEDILGRPRAEIVGAAILDFVDPTWREIISRRILAPSDERFEFVFLRPDGSQAIVSVLAHSCVYQGRPMRVAVHRDITLEKRAEEALRNVGAYNRSLIEVSLDPLVTISADGKITDVNESTVQATGMPRSLLVGSDFSDYFTEPEKARAGYQEVFAKGFVMDYPLSLRHVSGRTRDVLYNASVYRNAKGEIAGVFAAARDITEIKKLERELEYQAHKDMLTNLNNRRHFFELAEQELARSRRHDEPLSLLMMDLDNFKSVNDTYGHQTGDMALQKLSEICQQTFREFDLVGRVGGEEFAALLPVTEATQAVEVAERLRLAVESAAVNLADGSLLHFTISIGVASFGAKDEKVETVLKRADAALYKAKNTGRNQVCSEVNE